MARVRLRLESLQSGDLPPVCAVCARAADAHVRKTFYWRPKWPFLTSLARVVLFFTIIAWPILFLINETRKKRATVALPMCRRHRRYWIWRGFWFLAPLLVLVAFALTTAISVLLSLIPLTDIGGIAASLFLLFILWALAALVFEHTGVRAVEITKKEIVLSGVSPIFAELARGGPSAWEDAEYRDDGWEIYDPYPRTRPEANVRGKN